MATFASPRVQVTEIDISEYVSNLPSSVGVIVVRSRRGGFKPVFVTSTRQLRNLFCKDRKRLDRDVIELYAASNFLDSGYSALWVCRALNSSTKGACIVINTSDSSSKTTQISEGLSLNTDKTDYVYPDWEDLSGENITPLFLLYAKSPGDVGNGFRVKISDVNNTAKTFTLEIEEVLSDGSVEGIFNGTVSLDPTAKDGFGNSLYLPDVLELNNDIGVKINTSVAETGALPGEMTSFVSFAGGSFTEAVVGDLGDVIEQFKNKEQWDIDLLIQGGIGGDTWRNKLIEVAEARQDCMAILDVDSDMLDINALSTWRKTSFNVSSSYAAIFAPWLRIYDFDWDRDLYLPPSGFVAGMMARCDYEYDPWWVPAGLKRGVVKVLGLRRYYSQGDRDELDKLQINTFTRKPGVIALWNNRTLQSFESALSFIETRRLLNYIKKNICRILDAFLFEPLVDITRLRLVSMLDEFLRTIKQRLGLYDYRVVSDPIGTGNNPPAQIDQGMLTVEVYLKPVRAIRFIWLKAIITRTGYSLEERLGAY